MQITSIERHAGSGMWHGTAIVGGKNHTWFYRPRSFLRMAEQDEINPRCFMNIEPPDGARQIVLRAVRMAKAA
jgi:hypothetical protein